jgi:hypothetical protein
MVCIQRGDAPLHRGKRRSDAADERPGAKAQALAAQACAQFSRRQLLDDHGMNAGLN